MSYKKFSSELKGIHITWDNNKIFPLYKNTSGSEVSQRRINKVIKIVLKILEEEENKIKKAFKELANKKYKDKKINIEYNFNSSIERIKNTKVSNSNEDLYGESDFDTIWISANKLSDDHLVGTILHESLHYLATFNKNDICEKDEHYVMRLLGEDC